jgi:hypothetical protein
VVNRRALIVTDAVLACLFLVAGVANFVLGEPVNIVAGVAALALGAFAAVTACLFVASGGWKREKAPTDSPDQRVRVEQPPRTRQRQ